MPLGQYSLSLLSTLQPAMRPLVQTLLDNCEAAGIPCDLVQGARSYAEQQKVYDQGRTAPGPIVSNAPPGDSYHNFGLAVDLVPRVYKSLPNWNPTGPYWAQVGQIGEALGLTWGGRFSRPDKPHFELEAAPLSELKAYWNKFQQIMPITITPTEGGAAIIVFIGLAWFGVVQPMLRKQGMDA